TDADAYWANGFIAGFDDQVSTEVAKIAQKADATNRLIYIEPLQSTWSGHGICEQAQQSWFVSPLPVMSTLERVVSEIVNSGGVSPLQSLYRDLAHISQFKSLSFLFHPNPAGQCALALGVLRALGSDASLPCSGPSSVLTTATVPADVPVTQPSSGTNDVDIDIDLTAPAQKTATVKYATENGTATAGVDYRATAGTLSIPVGQSQGVISVPVLSPPRGAQLTAAATGEPLSFTVKLSDPVNMKLSSTSVTVTILPASTSANPAVALLFTNKPLSAPASSKPDLGPLTVELVDGSANPTHTAHATVVTLSSSSATGIFAAAAGGPPIRSVTIAAGQSTASFYYGDTKAGPVTLTATAPGLKSATQRETIRPAAAAKLVITSAPLDGEVGAVADLGPITVTEQDTFGHPATAPPAGTKVTLRSTSAAAEFATTVRGAPVRSLSIPGGSTSATFYYGDRNAGTPTITASAAGLSPAHQKETITSQPQALGACRPGEWTDIWTGKSKTQPDDFDDPSNWSLGLPGRTDNVCLRSATVPLISGRAETVGSIESFVPLSLTALTITHAPPPSSTTSQIAAFHANVSVAGKLSLAGPTVVDGAGTVLTWTGITGTGPMTGGGSLQVSSGATLDFVGQAAAGLSPPTFSLSHLSVAPGANLTLEGYIEADNCVVTNAGTITLGQSAIFGALPEPAYRVSAPVIVNTGEIVNTGTTVLSNGMTGWVFGDLRLGGKVVVDAGSLVLGTTSTEQSTASFSVADGTALDLDARTGTTLTLSGASRFSGQGQFETGHGYSGGTVVVPGRLGLPSVEVYAGTLDLDANAALKHVTLDGDGALAGTGDLTILPAGTLTTSLSGVLSVSGDVTIDPGAALDLGASPVLDGKGKVTIDKGATATVEGSSVVDIGQPVVNDGALNLVTGGPQQTAGVIACGHAGGGSLTNYGLIDLAGDSSIFPVYEGSALGCVFTNKGTLAKSAGTGMSVLGGVPNNDGMITINTGTVAVLNSTGGDFAAHTATSTGTFEVAGGATLALSNFYNSSVVLGPGSAVKGLDGSFGSLATTFEGSNGGTDTIEGTFALPTIDVGGGTLNLATPSSLAGVTLTNDGDLVLPDRATTVGRYTQTGPATLSVTIASQTAYGSIMAKGTASLSGDIAIALAGGYVPPVGTTFSVITADGGLSGTFSPLPGGSPFSLTYTSTKAILTKT
ncbi:MAG TPA: Calx-beta domain-containing protein, partial [Acidimicrobiales bacterium]|nr:Calx-beta domain-containing protein [Acidimicrobiales bacterium]